ncbi:trigger factor [Patescibacteria group bacterium]|nr:trigger factor [Patescibacteria group bacterium]
MKVTTKQLPKSQVELAIEVTAKELEPHLDKAAQTISKEVKISGFRPGKAPRQIVSQQVGEFKLWQEATNSALPEFYVKALEQEKIEAIGQPEIKIDKLAPNNPLSFKATVSYLPAIELPDYKNIKVTEKKTVVEVKKVDEALKELQKSRAKLAKVDRAAEKGDAIEISFNTFLNKVPIDQGESKNHPLIIGEGYFVPGFEDKIIGLKAGEKKEFTLRFPKKYHKKELADKDVDFKVEMNNVQQRNLPKLDDEFAKSLGEFKGIADLEQKIKDNLQTEVEEKEKSRLEIAIMEKIAAETKAELPEILVQAETEKMLNELKDNVAVSGGEFDKYLESIKKTEDDLKKEFKAKAEKRTLFGLILREIAKQEKVEVTTKELEEEVKHTTGHYQHDKQMLEKIQSDEYRDYARSLLVNRKVFEMLRKECVGK